MFLQVLEMAIDLRIDKLKKKTKKYFYHKKLIFTVFNN